MRGPAQLERNGVGNAHGRARHACCVGRENGTDERAETRALVAERGHECQEHNEHCEYNVHKSVAAVRVVGTKPATTTCEGDETE